MSSETTKELSGQTAGPGSATQPFAAECDGFVATEDTGVLILESLEHAEERSAEILAEIEVYETSGDAILVQPAENGNGAYRLSVTEVKHADQASDTAPIDSAGGACAAARPPIFYAAKRTHTIRRMTVAAAVLILALLAGFWYRHDIKGASAHMRRALVTLAVRFSSPQSTVKRESAAPTTTSESALAEKRQTQVTTTATVEHPSSPREQLADGAIVVIVQPREDLRRICLRYVGRYDVRLLTKISELNPKLTDPNHITVGQRILLPGPGAVGTTPERPVAAPVG